jgi:hypothetical protein
MSILICAAVKENDPLLMDLIFKFKRSIEWVTH